MQQEIHGAYPPQGGQYYPQAPGGQGQQYPPQAFPPAYPGQLPQATGQYGVGYGQPGYVQGGPYPPGNPYSQAGPFGQGAPYGQAAPPYGQAGAYGQGGAYGGGGLMRGMLEPNDEWDIPSDKLVNEDMDKMVQLGFIRKVYAILTCQLTVTFGMALTFNLQRSWSLWLYQNPWVLILASVFMCMSVCTMACVPKVARTSPTNYAMLGILSVCMGLILGYTTGKVSTAAFAIAAGMTSVVTLAITLFACQTKWDFTGAGVYAMVFLLVLMMFGIVASFVRNKVVQIIYASLGALIFSFYLLIDTQKIVGGKHRKYQFSIDDYAFAALTLYMDIINLFLYILELVAMTENN